jgi:hypothetical protein
MSADFQMYIVIGLVGFILAFLWSVIPKNKKKTKRPIPQKTPFQKKFNASEAKDRIRRRMTYKNKLESVY